MATNNFLSDFAVTGSGTFVGNVTAPSFTGPSQGAVTGAPDATIWRVSGQYPTWGIFYDESTPDLIQFKASGTATASISLDNGDYTGRNATFAGTVTLGSVPTIATTASTFLTTSSGVISSRTAAQVRSDIGAGTSSTTGTVTSVGLSHTGNAFSVGSSPVTVSGTIAIDVVGSGSQYITGDGNLESFPATITSGQASAITANTAKVGITSTQASNITTNNAKVGITSTQASNITTNNAKVGITSTQASNITANNAKVTDTGTPAILSNGSAPSLNSGITGLEVRTLIGAGSSSTSGTVTGTGVSGRVAFWNSGTNITSDADLTFDGTNLTVGGNITSGNGATNSIQWETGYTRSITGFSASGSTTTTLTLTQQSGSTITTSFSNPQGTTTPSNTQTFTNKSGSNNQWTNDAGYITSQGSFLPLSGGTMSGNIDLGDNNVRFGSTSGGAGDGILYKDSGGGFKTALTFEATNKVVLANRAANGEIHLRANTSVAGVGGEVAVATIKDTGIITFKPIGLDVSLANNNGNGFTLFTGGSSVTGGKIYYWTGSGWTLSTPTNSYNKLLAMARGTGTSGSVGMIVQGLVNGAQSVTANGQAAYLTTSGNITTTVPTDGYARIVGYAYSTTIFYFDPDKTWVLIASP